MARLTDNEITNLIISKGYRVKDLSTYKNKQSNILCECNKGHLFEASLENILKSNFRCPKCEGERYNANIANDNVPQKNGYRIIGLDQSSQNIGVSIYDNGSLVYYDLYRIVGELNCRMAKWFTFMQDTVIKQWEPDLIIFEDTQYQEVAGASTFRIVSEILGVGVAVATLNNINFTTVLSKVWKSEFQISGSNRMAQKRNSMKRVKEYFNIEVNDDVSDAILIGLWGVHKFYENWSVGASF